MHPITDLCHYYSAYLMHSVVAPSLILTCSYSLSVICACSSSSWPNKIRFITLVSQLYLLCFRSLVHLKMVEYASRTNLSYCRDYGIEEDSIDDMPLKSDPECYDDDGHLKRTGTHINHIFLFNFSFTSILFPLFHFLFSFSHFF